MNVYLDTSVLIASVTPEKATGAVLAWLERHANSSHAISDWTLVEFASALGLKVRSRQLTVEQAHDVRTVVDEWTTSSIDVLPVERTVFQRCHRLLDAPEAGLRAGDALHLAIAQETARVLVTLDLILAANARRLGTPVVVPTDESS